jgi:hypothetical protein
MLLKVPTGLHLGEDLWNALEKCGFVSAWRQNPTGMKSGTLANLIDRSRQQVHKLAKDGKIPGAKRTKGGRKKGGHFYFVDCPAMRSFVTRYRTKKFTSRERETARRGHRRKGPVDVIDRIARAVDGLGAHPLSRWSQAQREYLVELLGPVIDELATYFRGRRA